jgi:hypothetical protein
MGRVLVACEESGRVRDAFIARGHDAVSCDLLPSDQPGPHIQADVTTLDLAEYDMVIAFPPCTYLAVSGNRWYAGTPEREQGLELVRFFMNAPAERVAVENPIGVISTMIRKPDQIIHPWQYGHEASKKTCLWLKNLPLLEPTNIVGKGERVTFASGKSMPKWYADAWRLPPAQRALMRSRTFQGIADAMADQWGKLL